jgi:hypothetical protein
MPDAYGQPTALDNLLNTAHAVNATYSIIKGIGTVIDAMETDRDVLDIIGDLTSQVAEATNRASAIEFFRGLGCAPPAPALPPPW